MSKGPGDTPHPLLSVQGLTTRILTAAGPRTVVDDLSFSLASGELLAIIGESGSGKSIAMQSIMGLLPSPPAKVTAGKALFEGRDLLGMPAKTCGRCAATASE